MGKRQPKSGEEALQSTSAPERLSKGAETKPKLAKSRSPLPTVSICTLTYNRSAFIPLLQTCVAGQTYPHELIEWVIVDDSDNDEPPFRVNDDPEINVKHIKLTKKLTLGSKRNISHEHCTGEIIVYMDDDDYYPPQRISHAVERLLETGRLVAGATLLPIYFTNTGQAWAAGPYGDNHATANTFAFRRELLKETRYDDNATHAEEKAFLKNYQIPMAQLDPTQTILCMGHSGNTFDKRKLIQGGQNRRMNKLSDLPNSFIQPETLANYTKFHTRHKADSTSKPKSDAQSAETTITLDLGCGAKPKNPFQANHVCGVDIRTSNTKAGEIRCADLAVEPIPWANEEFNYITAFDFLEHIPRIIYAPSRRFAFVELMNEIWRCLKRDGLLLSRTPAYPHPEAFQDPTHVNIITEKTFTHYFSGPCWAKTYGFKGLFETKSQKWDGYILETILVKRTTR